MKEREIIDLAKKIFAVCLQKQVSGAFFFDGVRMSSFFLVAGGIEPPLDGRQTKLDPLPADGMTPFSVGQALELLREIAAPRGEQPPRGRSR